MDNSKNFVKVFTGIFATVVIMILVGNFLYNKITENNAKKQDDHLVSSTKRTLKGYGYTFNKITFIHEDRPAGERIIYWRVLKTSKPPAKDTTDLLIRTVFEHGEKGKYNIKKLEILPEEKEREYFPGLY